MKKKVLNWGETPFDKLSREALLLQCKRMFIALQSLQHVADQHRIQVREGYWAPGGVGSRAYSQGVQALAAAKQDFDEGSIHHAFFRYATPLLFTGEAKYGRDWVVCDKCQVMQGVNPGFAKHQPHYDSESGELCIGTLKPVTWADLDPSNAPPA